MKQFKNNFGVRGPLSLLKAFREEVELLGWKYQDSAPSREGFYFNANSDGKALEMGHFWDCVSYRKENRVFILPTDWDAALKVAAELEEEKFEVGDWVICIDTGTHTLEGNGGAGWIKGLCFEIGYFSDIESIAWGTPSRNGVYTSWLRKATPEEIEQAKSTLDLKIGGYLPIFDVEAETVSYGCQTFSKDQLRHLITYFTELNVEKLKKILNKL